MRSRYPRKIDEIGPTVAEQAAYEWPEDLLLPLNVSLGDVSLEPSDRETVRDYEQGKLAYSGDGVYYDAPDAEGVRKLYIYPAPTEATTLTLEWVFRPVPLSESTDEPTEIPEEFHEKLLHFVAATYYRTSEDNPELAAENARLADEAVSALMRYDNLRASGEGPWRVGIVGVTS